MACPENTVCVAGVGCKASTACEIAAARKETAGCEFYAVTLPNSQIHTVFTNNPATEFAVTLSNATSNPGAVSVVFSDGGYGASAAIPAHGELTLRLPWKAINSGYILSNSFHITTTVPVTAAQFNPIDVVYAGQKAFTADASLLLPMHSWGFSYMAAGTSYPNNGTYPYPAYITIVAGQEATTVQFTANAATAAGTNLAAMGKGSIKTILMNAGQVMQIASAAAAGTDLSGSIVTADKPIQAFSSNDCAWVPQQAVAACDHLEEQLLPLSMLSEQYIVAQQFVSASARNYYKIAAISDGTQVSTVPPAVRAQTDASMGQACSATLRRGDSCIIATATDFVLTSNLGHPVSVSQFVPGSYIDSQTGDPSLNSIAPVERYLTSYPFYTPPGFSAQYMIITSTVANPGVLLDNSSVTPTSFLSISPNAFSFRVPVSAGFHLLTSTKPVGLVIQGYAEFESYAFMSGFDMSPIVY